MISDLNSLAAAQTAAAVTPATPPAGQASSAAAIKGGPVVSSVGGSARPSVTESGRPSRGSAPPSAQSSGLQASSPFPFGGRDSLAPPINDAGQAAGAADFNALSAACRAVESYTRTLAKAAPGDLAGRLSGRREGLTVGVPPNASTRGGSSGGVRVLSPTQSVALRSPACVTLGTSVTVTAGQNQVAAGPLTLSAPQMAALGLSGTVASSRGLTWATGARFQAPSASVYSASDPLLADPASLTGRVEVRVDDGGMVQLWLCPAPLSSAADPTLFPSTGGTPSLAPGLWYLWIVLVLSAYAWP